MNIFKDYKSNLFLNLILVYVIWGSTYMGVKIGLTDLKPLLLTGMRFIIGGLFLLIISFFINGLPNKIEAKGSILLGSLLSGFGTSALAYAIQFLPTGLVALVAALLPIWVFILDYLFFSKTKPSNLSMTGMGIGSLGVLFLFNPFGIEGGLSLSDVVPILIVFASSSVWAYASLLSLRTKQLKGIEGLSVQMVTGGTLALTASFFLEDNQIQSILNMHRESVLALAYLILIGSFLGYAAFLWLISNAPPIITTTYAFVNPVVAIIIGYYLANEVLNSTSITASVLIISGVVFMTLGRKKKPKVATVD
ncbi:MAG: drug/metabolite transporter (DMT)-like permease [Arcticibacterium sp.]|jgi:drug/metabolite transporter (DMT)-like permease